MEIYFILFHPLKDYIGSLCVYVYIYVYLYIYVYVCVYVFVLGAVCMLCWDLSQTCGPPQATEDTGEFSFTLQPPNWFQNDLNPTGTFALLDKDRMHKDTVGDNLALESLCV